MARPILNIELCLTSHIHRRFTERLNFNGTIEELIEKLNTSLKDGYVIQNTMIYFHELNLVVPYVYDADLKQHIAKTVKQNIGFPKYCQKASVTWDMAKANLQTKSEVMSCLT